MAQVLSELIFPALLAAFTALLGYITYLLKESKRTNNANAKGTMLLLRREIVADYEKFVKRGEPMTKYDFDDLNELHDAYKALNGNGLTEKMYQAMMELDIRGE